MRLGKHPQETGGAHPDPRGGVPEGEVEERLQVLARHGLRCHRRGPLAVLNANVVFHAARALAEGVLAGGAAPGLAAGARVATGLVVLVLVFLLLLRRRLLPFLPARVARHIGRGFGQGFVRRVGLGLPFGERRAAHRAGAARWVEGAPGERPRDGAAVLRRRLENGARLGRSGVFPGWHSVLSSALARVEPQRGTTAPSHVLGTRLGAPAAPKAAPQAVRLGRWARDHVVRARGSACFGVGGLVDRRPGLARHQRKAGAGRDAEGLHGSGSAGLRPRRPPRRRTPHLRLRPAPSLSRVLVEPHSGTPRSARKVSRAHPLPLAAGARPAQRKVFGGLRGGAGPPVVPATGDRSAALR